MCCTREGARGLQEFVQGREAALLERSELMQLLRLEEQSCFTWSPGAGGAPPSPEAGAMGAAGSPLRLTAPICWMWHGEKATPGLR